MVTIREMCRLKRLSRRLKWPMCTILFRNFHKDTILRLGRKDLDFQVRIIILYIFVNLTFSRRSKTTNCNRAFFGSKPAHSASGRSDLCPGHCLGEGGAVGTGRGVEGPHLPGDRAPTQDHRERTQNRGHSQGPERGGRHAPGVASTKRPLLGTLQQCRFKLRAHNAVKA